MTSEPNDPVPDLLAELDRVAAIRAKAERDLDHASQRCREIVVELLKTRAVKRKDLIGRPFSSAGLTIIAREAGVTHRQRRQRP